MKYLLAGGSGQIGEMLFRHWDAQGHEVVNLTRRTVESTGKSLARPRQVHWDGQSLGAWASELESADVLVNLAGRSVNCRYNETNRATILNSRVDSTRALGRAMQAAADPPKLWLQSSTATIYAHRFDAANDEATGILGVGNADAPDTWQFSFDVASAWESAATDFQRVGVRQVLLRSAVVMSPKRKACLTCSAVWRKQDLAAPMGMASNTYPGFTKLTFAERWIGLSKTIRWTER